MQAGLAARSSHRVAFNMTMIHSRTRECGNIECDSPAAPAKARISSGWPAARRGRSTHSRRFLSLALMLRGGRGHDRLRIQEATDEALQEGLVQGLSNLELRGNLLSVIDLSRGRRDGRTGLAISSKFPAYVFKFGLCCSDGDLLISNGSI